MEKLEYLHKPISLERVSEALGVSAETPLTVEDMTGNLVFTVFENPGISPRAIKFVKQLLQAAAAKGINILDYQDTLNEKGRIREGITILYPIVKGSKDIAIDKVSSLYQNPVIGIFDMEPPIDESATNQAKLNTIIKHLTEEIIHLAIFLGEEKWTIYTMNGGVINYSYDVPLDRALSETLISKLTAQVIPPEILSNIKYNFSSFDTRSHPFEEIAKDLQHAARALRDSGLLMSHLKLKDIKFRSRFHERIARSYLDERSGMSYGFLVWQKPLPVKRARKVKANSVVKHDETIITTVAGDFIVNIPEVSVVSTRSGCDKTDINISRDIVRMTLSNGKIWVDTPFGMSEKVDCKPSYDTLTILSNALGNYFNASILKSIQGDNEFSDSLEYKGLSLFHWHGYPSPDQVPAGLFFHGDNNPAVSCSTAQSALYTMFGKLSALNQSLEEKMPYMGDVHIEPHHGSNISSIYKLEQVVKMLIENF